MNKELDSLVNQLIESGIRYEEAVSEFERQFIKKVLDESSGNQSRAAKVLGIHRNTLSRKIEDLKLNDRLGRRKRSSRQTAFEVWQEFFPPGHVPGTTPSRQCASADPSQTPRY